MYWFCRCALIITAFLAIRHFVQMSKRRLERGN
jgi:hypothetical protein